MNIFITGIAGVLGSSLARLFLSKGYKVTGNDRVRIEEAWRLEGIKGQITYLWKSSIDLTTSDIFGTDIIIDCALESADRPYGISSPKDTIIGNILPPLHVLETVRRIGSKILIIYPSSFNALYGHKPGLKITEETSVLASGAYGWSKGAAELLYLAYHKAYDIPVIITRVGSGYGPKMRSDELIARLIIHALQGKDFNLRSPEAKRLWCFVEDILDFYDKLIEDPYKYNGKILHAAGNKNNEIVTNSDLAMKIKQLTNSNVTITPVGYEVTEIVDGKPIDFTIDSSYTMNKVGWEPKHSLEEGLSKTIAWFRENITRYKVE